MARKVIKANPERGKRKGKVMKKLTPAPGVVKPGHGAVANVKSKQSHFPPKNLLAQAMSKMMGNG